jgi:hypothetical protein
MIPDKLGGMNMSDISHMTPDEIHDKYPYGNVYTLRCVFCKCTFISDDLDDIKCKYCSEGLESNNSQNLQVGDQVKFTHIYAGSTRMAYYGMGEVHRLYDSRCELYHDRGCFYSLHKYEKLKKIKKRS